MALATKGAALLVAASVWFLIMPVASPAAQPSPSAVCEPADSLLHRREVDTARDAYLDILDNNGPQCAIDGLEAVAAATSREDRFCAEGAKLAANNQDDEAVRAYAAALHENIESECALEGLAPPQGHDSWWERFPGYLPQFPIHLAAVLLMALVAFAAASVVASLISRRTSLVVRPFADTAVTPSVGAAFGGLVEQELISVWRTEQRVRDDGYDLDFVVANVELFSDEDALAGAVGDMAQVGQLQLIAAVLSVIDNLGIKRRLAATGELLPAGPNGSGVSLALYNRQQLEARGVLWESAAPSPPASSPSVPEGGEDSPAPAATPYYRFAGPAAAWVQYEAALFLDSRVSVITSNAESFSLLTTGIGHHRDNDYAQAAEKYVQALKTDPDNVGALINFASLVARSGGLFPESILLLERAQNALANAYDYRP